MIKLVKSILSFGDRDSKDIKKVRNYRILVLYAATSISFFWNMNNQAVIETLSVEVRELTYNLHRYKVENKMLMMRESALLEALADIPIPIWVKESSDRGFIVRYVNRAYVDEFLKPRGYTYFDYINETDYAVWDSVTAKQFQYNDSLTVALGNATAFPEMVPDSLGIRRRWIVGKTPKNFQDSIWFVAGTAVRKDPDEEFKPRKRKYNARQS
ncbi:hypothetical protein PP178_03960 [Zeaxanthinibacter sp. PT1]|uniref:hypothetical protein n=1 Tax=Zeaxanthinibacter TaxID=561554 RepID=UPI00234BE8B5|nr:hypothetical protein [Zeaxanthinibacter sp. PT1]MDC6350695.1 hypothetical protein [Zeaxanthinibacter sp. PT1]